MAQQNYTELDGIARIKRLNRFLDQSRIGGQRASNVGGDVCLGGVDVVSRSRGVSEQQIV
jgi:hypothetical protein